MSTGVQISNSTVGLWCLQVCFAAVPALGPSFASLRNSKELKGTRRNSKELKGTQSRKEVDEVPFFDSNLPLHCHFPTHGLARVGRRGCSTATSWVVDAPALVSGRTRTRRITFMMVYVLSSSCYMGPGLVYRTRPAQMTQTQRKLKINR